MTHTTTVTIVTTNDTGSEVFKTSYSLANDLTPKSHFGAAVGCAEDVLGRLHQHCFPTPTDDIFAKEPNE